MVKRTEAQQKQFDEAEAENKRNRGGAETFGDSEETKRTRAQKAQFGAAEMQNQESDTTLNVQNGTLGQEADSVG